MPLNFEKVERTVPAELAGERADRVLAALVPEVSRAEAQRLLERGQVLADGSVPAGLLRAGRFLRGLLLRPFPDLLYSC